MNRKKASIAVLLIFFALIALTSSLTNTKPVYGDTPADRDAWTEASALSSWFYDINRGALTADSSVKQVGSASLKAAKNTGTGWHYMQYPNTKNLALNLNTFAGLRFWVREDTGLNVGVRLYSSDGNLFQRTISLTLPNTWYLQDVPVGTGAGGWGSVGSPNWASINFIEFGSASDPSSTQSMWLDGLYFYSSSGTTASSTSTTGTSATTTTTGSQGISFNVRPGATQIIITITWVGSGSATIQLTSPSSTTFQEASGTIYEKLTVSLVGGVSTTTHVKRVTFTSGITSGTWTLTLTLAGITDYTVNIETV